MFRQADNRVKIEGILAESDLKYGSFVNKRGETIESIGGSIKVLVNQEINGTPVDLEVPVYMFSSKYTKSGKVNPSYESIETVMKEFVSIAAAGNAAQADKVRITGASIRMNEFYGQNGQLVSQPRIYASFVSHAVGEFRPEATFSLEFMVSNIAAVVDADGVEVDPRKLGITVVVPQYTDESASVMNVDVVNLFATSANVMNAIDSYWEAGKCYKASGRLNFSSRTEEVLEEVDFGEAQRKVRTINVSEFIITGGSQEPLDGDFAWTTEDIKAGIAERKNRLEKSKNSTKNAKKAPAPAAAPDKKGLDLGF